MCFPAIALVAACSSDKGTDGDIEADPAPAAVTDLRIDNYTPTSVTLAWTAPLSDDNHGMVNSYDIRYTTYEPEADDWAMAIQVLDEPGPLPGGMTQTMDIDSLAFGQTYYFGMKCIGSAGAQSGLSNMAEVELPIDFDVTIPDAALDSVLRQLVNKPTGTLRYIDMITITEIVAEGLDIADLTGLQYCENLAFLHVNENQISDLTPLSGLDHLWAVGLYGNQISDVSPLAAVTSLGQLVLGGNEITDISSLATLTNLSVFRVQSNAIVDVGAVQYMTKLEWLDLSNNEISDLSPLVANTGLGAGDEADVRWNPLSETAINTHIPALQARGVEVRY